VNKAALRRLALEVREEVSLTPHDPFDPFELAELYGVDVVRLSEIHCSPEALAHFQVSRPEVFSGALVPLSDGSTVIVENDAHVLERRLSTASHEMSHVVLEHPFQASLTDAKGCRVASQGHESEATELSGELLLPSEAARRLAYYGASDEEAAEKFGVSVPFARWRLNDRKIATRTRARWGRP
jgi:Zn-dependent peptidase ImmA (M78 family)